MKQHPRSISARRWQNFKRNRRGRISLWLFSALLFASLFAEFLANDKPILVKFDGQYYFPNLFTYTETDFEGELATEADYKDPFVQKLIEKHGWIIMPPIEYSYGFSVGTNVLAPPSPQHLLGTDDMGRDVMARAIYGFRLSVLFGLALTICSSIIGIAAGAVQGYFGGWVDLIFQRVLEVWSGVPVLFVLIILASIVEPNIIWLFCIILLFSWTKLVDLVRAEFFRARNFEYVRAARALGVSERAIIFRHILPNALVSTFTYLPFILTGAVTVLTELDFLGFGLPAQYPSLGELALQGKNNLDAPWLAAAAFATLTITLSLLLFIGEALRDAFDPRKI